MSKVALARQRCESCHAGAPQLSKAEKAEALSYLDGWAIEADQEIDQLVKRFAFKNFKKAMAFATELALLAEQNGHHPSIKVEWGQVEVRWWTHKINGLHRNDAICAAKTDRLLED